MLEVSAFFSTTKILYFAKGDFLAVQSALVQQGCTRVVSAKIEKVLLFEFLSLDFWFAPSRLKAKVSKHENPH